MKEKTKDLIAISVLVTTGIVLFATLIELFILDWKTALEGTSASLITMLVFWSAWRLGEFTARRK